MPPPARVAVVSGLVLYPPFMRKLEFGTVRRDRSPRVKWLGDLKTPLPQAQRRLVRGWDALSWFALGAPVAVAVWFVWRPRPK